MTKTIKAEYMPRRKNKNVGTKQLTSEQPGQTQTD